MHRLSLYPSGSLTHGPKSWHYIQSGETIILILSCRYSILYSFLCSRSLLEHISRIRCVLQEDISLLPGNILKRELWRDAVVFSGDCQSACVIMKERQTHVHKVKCERWFQANAFWFKRCSQNINRQTSIYSQTSIRVLSR